MTIILAIIMVTDFFIFACCVLAIYRTRRVGDMRRGLIAKLFTFMDWEWRLKEYESVSFEKMIFTFWKPITPEAFYKDMAFLEPSSKSIPSPFYAVKKHE